MLLTEIVLILQPIKYYVPLKHIMLSRRHLRIKALQGLYAFQQSGNDRMELAEKQLLQSVDKILDLSMHHFSLMFQLADFAERRIEENKLKQLPTADDLNPNLRFIENPFLKKLRSNRDISRNIDQLKISWVEHDDLVRKIYNLLRESDLYQNYMAMEEVTWKDHRDFIISLFNDFIVNDHVVEFILEEKNIFWATDYHEETLRVNRQNVSNSELFRFIDQDVAIKLLKQNADEENGSIEIHCEESGIYNENDYFIAQYVTERILRDVNEADDDLKALPRMIKVDLSVEYDDRHYLLELFRKTIIHRDETLGMIAKRADNWEPDRIAVIDIILIQMALTELMYFSSIPIKVTMNEYIELTKIYSSPNSKMFVNGLLDRLVADLKEENKIVKTGRGLID